jgi:glycine/D-amino acid oxidase-like deaminating enzyme
MPAFRDLSPVPTATLWYEPPERRSPLTSDVDADVAIVGAGHTGLWTAYYLLKTDPSLRVVVVEQEYVGYGASGRNGGWASAIFPISTLRRPACGYQSPRPFDDHFPNILCTSSRDGRQCGPAMFPFSWFHHQSRLQANFAAQGAGTGSDRNRASRLTRSLLSLIITSPDIR